LQRVLNNAKNPIAPRQGDKSAIFALTNSSDTALISFILAARKAAESSGFSKKTSAQFGAALVELKSNVIDHSMAVNTGVLYFHAGNRWFEFGVTDSGQGVLASLRTFSGYSSILNHGDALRIAVSEGGTRYGPQSMHGHGFPPLFKGLAGYHGYLRWRSGDYALIIDARNPSASSGDLVQKPMFDGLTLSALCSVDRTN